MGFLVNQCISGCVKSVKWRGRVGGMHIFQEPSVLCSGINAVIGCLHGSHGDQIAQCLADLSLVAREFPRNAQYIHVGDWNIDQLPVHSLDPFSNLVNRSLHHRERRVLLDCWLSSKNLVLELPDVCSTSPGGSFGELVSTCPITRVPLGDQSGLPSCLDYASCSVGFVSSSFRDWNLGPADHALVGFICTPTWHCPRRVKKFWNCVSSDDCVQQMSHIALHRDMDLESICTAVRSVQDLCTDRRTCEQERTERMPVDLREVYRTIAHTHCRTTARALRIRAWDMRKEWVNQVRLASNIRKVEKGHVLCKSKKLFPLEGIRLDNGICRDPVVCCRELNAFYERKWRAHDMNMAHNVMDFILRNEGRPIDLSVTDVTDGFARLRTMNKLDQNRVCVKAFEFLFLAQPDAFTQWLRHFAGCSARMSQIVVGARIYGKQSSIASVNDTRAILPLPSIAAILDSILPYLILSCIESSFPPIHGVFHGARPRTQALDIAHGLHSVVEKSLDQRSVGAIGQADVKQFFDSLNLLRIFRLLVSEGLSEPLAAACLRHQLLPKVLIKFGSASMTIQRRTMGSLTGSRLAGMSARVPVEHLCRERAAHWKDWGFPCPSGTLTLSTYVDNVYAAGKSCYAVSAILDDASSFLSVQWGLEFKQCSQMVMAPSNALDLDVTDSRRWPVVDEMEVLGHLLQCDSGIESCFQRTVEKAWRAFFCNCASRDASRLPSSLRILLLKRSVEPILRFRWTRWPFRKDHADRLNGLQRQMLNIISGVRPMRDDSAEEFVRRRAKIVRSMQGSMGYWGEKWAVALGLWKVHIQRPRNQHCWPAIIFSLRSPEELALRRCNNSGRPLVRQSAGFIQRRWAESLVIASDWLTRRL